jgi:prepilin-type N-terminal cleavage/methylation domain-containing protein
MVIALQDPTNQTTVSRRSNSVNGPQAQGLAVTVDRSPEGRRPKGIRVGKASRPPHADADAEAGFSLVELMVALSIFAVVVAGVATGMDAAMDLARTNRQRSTAAYVAGQEIEKVRAAFSADAATPALGTSSSTTPAINGIAFTVTRTVSWTNPGSNPDACTATGTTPSGQVVAYKRVRVRVTWPDMGGTQPVSSETLLTPPTAGANLGHLVVTVADRNGAALTSQSVPGLSILRAASGTVPAETQPVTDDGCAVFTNLPAGNYQLTVQGTSYIDRQRVSPPTQTAGVQADAVTAIRFDIDRPASLTITGSVTPSTAAMPTGTRVTLANTAMTGGTTSFAWTSGATVGPLYPFLNGYQAWAGGCTDADPTYTGYGGSRDAALTVTPGATTTGTVRLVAQTVQVQRGILRTPAAGEQVRAVHTGPGTCPAGNETLTFSATTALVDGKVTIALPYGDWRIEVVGESRYSTPWPVVVVTPWPVVQIRPNQATTETPVRIS